MARSRGGRDRSPVPGHRGSKAGKGGMEIQIWCSVPAPNSIQSCNKLLQCGHTPTSPPSVYLAKHLAKHGCTWAALARGCFAHSHCNLGCGFFRRPALGFPIARASNNKTFGSGAEDIIPGLVRACKWLRFCTCASQLADTWGSIAAAIPIALRTTGGPREAHRLANHSCGPGAYTTAANWHPCAFHENLWAPFPINGGRAISCEQPHSALRGGRFPRLRTKNNSVLSMALACCIRC